MGIKSLANRVKTSPFLYSVYYNLGSFGLSLIRLFLKPDDKLILFNSYGGKKYDDSPKEIYETMKSDPRFEDFRFVWAFHEPEKFEVEGCQKIKCDTLKYFTAAMKAKVWITNSSIERGLSFKSKHTIYINTHHGTPIKKCGLDLSKDTKSFATKSKSRPDFITVQSEHDAKIHKGMSSVKEQEILRVGLPRNDRLARDNSLDNIKIRSALGINENAKVILYAPTYREYNRDKSGRCEITFPFDLKNWRDKLGEDFVVLFRAHYEVSKFMQLPKGDKNIIDVSAYPELNDLIIISDVLVSDYSGIIYDYSITEKPILTFTYDYDEYALKRGVYLDVREYFTDASTEEQLLKNIIGMDCSFEIKKSRDFKEKFVEYYGNASTLAVDKIYGMLKK